MNAPAPWLMALIYWLHLLATVLWVGSLAAWNLLFLPAARRALDSAAQLKLISAAQQRLEPLAWFCMATLLARGMFQMSANEHYDGFLNPSSQWSFAILVKHGFAVLMVVVSAAQTWEVLPAIRRALMQKGGASQAELEKLNRRETLLLRINFALSALILAATAFARAA